MFLVEDTKDEHATQISFVCQETVVDISPKISTALRKGTKQEGS